MAMDVLVPKLQTRNLRRAPDAAAYQLYRAAQEWRLGQIRFSSKIGKT